MKNQVIEAIKSVFVDLNLGMTDFQISEASSKTMDCSPQFGTCCNTCVMGLSKHLKMKPLNLAKMIADAVAKKLPGITVSISGPGFLNFK